MKALRRLGFALWLALALVAGQQLALLHELGHATEPLVHQDDGTSTDAKCDQHYALAQFAGAAGAAFAVPAVDLDVAQFAQPESGALPARALAYRSQAPPALLA
jgi:hypothetical protein